MGGGDGHLLIISEKPLRKQATWEKKKNAQFQKSDHKNLQKSDDVTPDRTSILKEET